ncbi:MAG TPA: asparagine synthase (glutamine-hydrolyzing) [Phycisphaerae bacterium]|nr:asparagine synthase (glutamine-hydrolyzing) [Phycisphaerae bacterium]
MCGILGGISARPFDEPILNRLPTAVDSLAHRGPDDRGEYVTADRRAFLGHRRLSIIDLAGGHQPLLDETGSLHLCYNGEIYNFRDLQACVTARGHKLATRTDGEPALHLYQDEPEQFVAKLSGMFAVAILDESRHRLTLARDRLGIKPLFYFFDGTALLFASELKAILALLPSRPEVDDHAIRQFMRWKYVPAPLTIYRNIFKLPPAHMLIAEPGEGNRTLTLDLRRYWDVDYGVAKLNNEEDAADQLDARLRESVRGHLESDVEVGALLSGGVDSSLVVAMACEVGGRPIKTFSVGFEESGFDQLPFARVVAEKYRTEHFEETVRLDPLETLAKLARQFDEPFADSSALACLRVCEVAAKHVKVALTGDGGDESFGGYHRYEQIGSRGELSAWDRLVARTIIATSTPLFSAQAKYLKRYRERLASPLAAHELHQVLMDNEVITRLLGPPGSQSDGEDVFGDHRRRAEGRGWSPVEIAQYIDLSMYLPDDILTKVDRTSMSQSLECRVPLLDHSVTDFSASLDSTLKVRGGIRKYLLKKVAERYLPAELLHRPKMGFRVPIRRWLKRDLLDEAESLLRHGQLVSRGMLSAGGIAWICRQQRRPWIDLSSQIWALMCFEHWARSYLV